MGHQDETARIKIETMCVTTRCTSRTQFVTLFRKFCSRTSCFIPSPQTRPVGTLTAFMIQLADGTLVLHGDGVIIESWPEGNNPYKRPGVLIEINRLTQESKELLEEITVPRSTATRVPLATQAKFMQDTMPIAAPHLLNATRQDELPPLVVDLQPAAAVQPSTERNVLPANPLTEMTDDLLDAFIECTLKDDVGSMNVQMVAAGSNPRLPTIAPTDAGADDAALRAPQVVVAPEAAPVQRASGPEGPDRAAPVIPAATARPADRRPRLAGATHAWRAVMAVVQQLWARTAAGRRRWWLLATVASVLAVALVVTAWST